MVESGEFEKFGDFSVGVCGSLEVAWRRQKGAEIKEKSRKGNQWKCFVGGRPIIVSPRKENGDETKRAKTMGKPTARISRA